jgi:tetratricopeptide (TPR) repeat protein
VRIRQLLSSLNEGDGCLKYQVLPEPKMVGREKELVELQHCLDSAISGNGRTIFVSGEAGSGKTRLALEFLEKAKKKSVLVLSGWCLSNAAVPYFPFLEAFQSIQTENEEDNSSGSQLLKMKTWLAERNLSEETEKSYALSPQVWKDQAFAVVIKELLFLSTRKTVILFIDDLHWADSASLALLHYIARTVASERIMVLATFRSEEIRGQETEGQTNALVETMRLLGREGIFREIKLSHLRQEDVYGIAESMLGGKIAAALVKRLGEESRGNALFVVESLRMLFEQKVLTSEDGEWNLKVEQFGIPDKVKDVIQRRFDALSSSQKKLLEAASMIGEKFDPWLVAAVVSQENLDALNALRIIETSGRLIYCDGNRYRFEHSKVREMLSDDIPNLMKKEYHLKIAQTMEKANEENKKFSDSDVAYHYVQAEQKDKAIVYSLAAGQDALARFSNIEAIKHFNCALQAIEEKPEASNKKRVAVEGLGNAYFANNNFEEAIKAFSRLAEMENGAAKLRALRKAMFAAWFKGDSALLAKFTELAEQNATADRLESARVLHQKARVVGLQGHMTTASELLDQALKIFEEEYALEDIAWVLFAAGHGYTTQNQLEKGIISSLRAIALYNEMGNVRSQMEAYLNTGFCFLDACLFKEAIGMFKKVIQINDELKLGDYIHAIPAFTTLALLMLEDLEAAISKVLKALELSEKTDSALYTGYVYAALTTLYSIKGDTKLAEENFTKLNCLPQAILSNIFSQVYINIARAAYFAGKNQFEKSGEYFKDHLKFLSNAYRNPGSESGARQIHAWILSKQGKMKEAKTEFEQALALVDQSQKAFEHVNINANLMMHTDLKVNQTFEIRLDLVNISRNEGSITRIDNLLLPEAEITSFPPDCLVLNSQIQFREKSIAPFQVRTLTLDGKFLKAGTYKLDPVVVYLNDLKKTCLCRPMSMTIVVHSTPIAEISTEKAMEQSRVKFASDSTQKVYNYLSNAFKEDSYFKMLPKEESGWRTLMQIVNEGHVTKHSMYGQTGHTGEVVAELKRLRLVEAKIFSNERGRGGNILKLRILAKEQS